jgi:hypothetical protein
MTTFRVRGGSEPTLQARSGGLAKPGTLSIDSPTALAQLRRSLWLPQVTKPSSRIVLNEDTLGAMAKRAEARVNELYASCGCETGALAVLVTAVGLAVWSALGNVAIGGRGLLVDLGALVAAAVAGKLAGIAGSRMLLFWLLWRLERRLARTQAGYGNVGAGGGL